MRVLIVLLCFINASWAQGNFGAGIIIGNLTGFSFNNMLDKDVSIDAAFAFDFSNKFEVYSTFLKRENGIAHLEGLSFDFYYGIGVKYENHDNQDDFFLGPRVPVGLSHRLQAAPVEIALEISGYYALIEDTDFDLEVGLLGRYYF